MPAKYLYRGVGVQHPKYSYASQGIAVPGDPSGTLSPDLHNLGGYSSISPYTSWTRSRSIAILHASIDGPGGIILSCQEGPPSPRDGWKWIPSPDRYIEQEVLLHGVRYNLRVFRL